MNRGVVADKLDFATVKFLPEGLLVLRQVQAFVNQGRLTCFGIGYKHTHLAIINLAQPPTILADHTHRFVSFKALE
jgi:hypothetical protein